MSNEIILVFQFCKCWVKGQLCFCYLKFDDIDKMMIMFVVLMFEVFVLCDCFDMYEVVVDFGGVVIIVVVEVYELMFECYLVCEVNWQVMLKRVFCVIIEECEEVVGIKV